jgi:hypothetical protein
VPQKVCSPETFIVQEGKFFMVSKKLSRIAGGLVAAASMPVVMAVPAFAACGDPGQPPCTGPVPTTDQVVAILAELTDPDMPAANKTDIVTPGFSSDEAQNIDDRLNRMRAPALPEHFVVTDTQPAPKNFAGATVASVGNPRQSTFPKPIVLVEQGGHWLITRDTALAKLESLYQAAVRHVGI